MIQEADRRVRIVTSCFLPDDVLLRSLVVKARAGCGAGCGVTLILLEKSYHPITDYARRNYVRELHRTGGDFAATQPRDNLYSTASRRASQLASMMLSLTPTVPHTARPSPLSISTRVREPVPAPLSSIRTL